MQLAYLMTKGDEGMRCRCIMAIDTDQFETVEDARRYMEDMADIVWDELCDLHDPMPKVLDVYEVKE